MKADEFLLFLAVTCEGTRVWCWGYTLLFTNFVSRLVRVHDAFTFQRLTPHALSSGVSSWSYLRRRNTPSYVVVGPTFATVSVSEQLHHLHATSPSQDNSYDVKKPLQHNRWQTDG
ncbi:hypothetical protein NC653_025119 [Populus alba x Populus x berolinensis]|uniref:Uncharacterized protein n=1 Tax=Populus alba x Populus x berolinensis TaxID=444605 RepID=A0AAD6Q9J8_9ROSI|nr:hypothetical protein NC653_025119 [Populus alba x Populus x berolinensis]